MSTSTHTTGLGDWGEAFAADYLENLGWRILDRNWRCAEGELDLVALDGDDIVAVEVKTRRTTHAGHPLEAITWHKLHTVRQLASLWVRQARGEGLVAASGGIRVDAIGIVASGRGTPDLRHVRGLQW